MTSERLRRQIERLLDEAEEALAQREWETVRERAQDALAIDPDHSEAEGFRSAAERALAGQSSSSGVQESPSPRSAAPAPTVVLPTSFSGGRYQVEGLLGEGGKKKVYLAHDTLLDRDVALALIKTEGLDEAGRTRVTREAQAMGRLGSHPHIVTVFDLGEEDGQSYMVTELMGGGDVEGLVEKAHDHRIPLGQTIDITKAVCRGLEFAHSRGIIHRDLKPGNVWLTAEGVAKIGDFGLAVALDRSRLTQRGMMVGSVSYMPPERALGGEITPRSDLYSLGATLYEMITGRPPFVGDESVGIIGQHLNASPVDPTWHNPKCPPTLEALVLQLLAKDPANRPRDASDVLGTLDAIYLSVADDQIAPPSANPLDGLARGTFVGRDQELRQAHIAVDEAFSGKAGLLLVTGENGIGKSRFAECRPSAIMGHI